MDLTPFLFFGLVFTFFGVGEYFSYPIASLVIGGILLLTALIGAILNHLNGTTIVYTEEDDDDEHTGC